MVAILNSAILDTTILHKKSFTCSFWLNLMMAAILNSAMLDSDTAILDSVTLLSSLRFNSRNILPPFWLWLKLIQYDSNSFILTQLDDGSHLEFCHLVFSHLHKNKLHSCNSHPNWWWQPSWILPSWIQTFCTKKTHLFILAQFHNCSQLEFCYLGYNHFAQKKIHLFILTQLDDGSHPEFCHVGFRHCHLGFSHLVIFSQFALKNILSTLWLKLVQSDSNSFILTQLDDGSHLEFCHHGFSHFA